MKLVFDRFEIDLDGRQLFLGGEEIPLERRAADMLCYLAARPGRLIGKDELLAEVWQARALSDGVLTNTASKLRKALGQAAQDAGPLETVHGRGYRWRAVERKNVGPGFPPTADDSTADGPFVGRFPALQVLFDAMQRAAGGRGQLVLIRGEAGIGKTRTLKEVSARARQHGFRSWIGAAYEAEGAPAYWPWVQILRASREELSSDGFRRHVPARAWALPLLVPELGGTAAPSSGVDAPSVRFQLFDELTRFFASASASGPILAAIEDLHSADSGTAELLAHVARALERHPILFVATLRDFAPISDESRDAISRLERGATSLALSGLSKEEITALLEAANEGNDSDDGVAEVLFARTRGNPFFIRQILGHLYQQDVPIDSANLAAAELPTAVRDIIRQRLSTLGNAARAALDVASVVGQEFDAQLVADAVGTTLEEILGALEPSLRMRIIEPRPAVHRFAFAHGLLRDALYDELGLSRSGALHSRLASILAARPLEGAKHVGEVARHYLLAVPSELEKCVRYCCEAAETARRASGFEAAADFLSRALQKLEVEGGDERIRCELLLMLGPDYFSVGNIQGGWRALAQGLALARRSGEPRLLGRAACSLVDWHEIGGFEEAATQEAIEEALRGVADDDAEMRAELLARRARFAFELPVAERAALLDEAARFAERAGSLDARTAVAVCRALVWNPTRPEEGLAAVAAHRAFVAANPKVALDPRFPVQRFGMDLSEYLHALISGDTALADQAAGRFAATAERSPHRIFAVVVQIMRAGRALRERRFADLDDAIVRLRESGDLTGALGKVWFPYTVLSAEARGEWASLRELALPDVAVLRDLPRRQRAGTYLWFAWLCSKAGRPERSRSFLAEVSRSDLSQMPVQHGDLGILCYLAEIYREEKDVEGAVWLREKLMPHAALHAVGPAFEYRGPVTRYIDMLSSMIDGEAKILEGAAP